MTTQYWITGTAGDWSTAADWQSGAVPGSTDNAVINNSNFTVTVNGTAVANQQDYGDRRCRHHHQRDVDGRRFTPERDPTSGEHVCERVRHQRERLFIDARHADRRHTV